jgi:hypothetical protein
MPAYQSIPEFALSEKYHLKAVCCEKCAGRASDQSTEQECRNSPRNGIRWQTKPRKCRMTLRGMTVGWSERRANPNHLLFQELTNYDQRLRNSEGNAGSSPFRVGIYR